MNYTVILLIIVVPLVGSRDVVPYAIATGIPMWRTSIIGVVSSMPPVPIIFFFTRRVPEWGTDKPVIGGFFTWCLKKGHNGGEKLAEMAGDRGLLIALLLFVGVPILGTGTWIGTLAVSTLDWNFKQSIIAVMLGVILTELIMGILTIPGLGAFS